MTIGRLPFFFFFSGLFSLVVEELQWFSPLGKEGLRGGTTTAFCPAQTLRFKVGEESRTDSPSLDFWLRIRRASVGRREQPSSAWRLMGTWISIPSRSSLHLLKHSWSNWLHVQQRLSTANSLINTVH